MPKPASAGNVAFASPDSASAIAAVRSNEPEPPGRYQSVDEPAAQNVSPAAFATADDTVGALASTRTSCEETGSAFPTASKARKRISVVWATAIGPT